MFHFYAYLSKLKYIIRWGLKRNVETENVKEHSFDVAMIAHSLALIRNTYFGGNLNPDRLATMALYHDATEVLTGDLPGPIKYFNPSIAEAYKSVEQAAEEKLLEMLPSELRDHYEPLFNPERTDIDHKRIVKAADIIAAYLKCLQEVDSGNHEFVVAKDRVESMLAQQDLPEVVFFLDKFVPSFRLTLDELG